MTGYDAVLFDNDGVLVTPPRYESQSAATRAAFEAVGVADARDEHVDAVVDGVTVEELHAICEAYDVTPDEFWSAREDHDERSQFDDFRTGARDAYTDLAAVRALDVPAGVVSNNHHTTVAFVLDRFELRDSFETYYGRGREVADLDRKKPDTHYLDRAIADTEAENPLYVGDRESDLEVARAAGIDSALVRRDHNRDLVSRVEPTHVVDSLYDIHALVDD